MLLLQQSKVAPLASPGGNKASADGDALLGNNRNSFLFCNCVQNGLNQAKMKFLVSLFPQNKGVCRVGMFVLNWAGRAPHKKRAAAWAGSTPTSPKHSCTPGCFAPG